MAGKFARQSQAAGPRGTIRSTDEATLTHEGGRGFVRDAKSELFLLAASNFVSEQTFYEDARSRDSRFVKLIHQVTNEDPNWVRGFARYLRETMNMRSAPIVIAAEYVKAGGKNGRTVVDSVMLRADEPAEMLAYWTLKYGRNVPMPVKRGVADAVQRLYTERNVIKYDGTAHTWRFADVINLTHPTAKNSEQGALFEYLTHRFEPVAPPALIAQDRELLALPEESRREALPAAIAAHWPWERVAGWLPGGMDAEAWQALIPNMGYMALLRNLRNFEEVNVDDATKDLIRARLTNVEEVARSRQLPMRFFSAYRATNTLTFARELEAALELSLQNVPQLPGRTLILIDCSGSMSYGHMSDRSGLRYKDAAAIFGSALALRADVSDVYLYGSSYTSLEKGSLMRMVETISRVDLGGTMTWQAVNATFKDHDRVVILTDEQAFHSESQASQVPLIYTWNLAGYRPGHAPSGSHGRYSFGGLSDAGFRMMQMLESHRGDRWPWEL